MCVFEILHFLPLALIVVSTFSLKGNLNRLFKLSIAVLSIIGLFAGNHMHTEHLEVMGIIDPCNLYLVSLSVSLFALIKSLMVKPTNINA